MVIGHEYNFSDKVISKNQKSTKQKINNRNTGIHNSVIGWISSKGESESTNSDNNIDEQEHREVRSISNAKNDTISVIEEIKFFMITEGRTGQNKHNKLASVFLMMAREGILNTKLMS